MKNEGYIKIFTASPSGLSYEEFYTDTPESARAFGKAIKEHSHAEGCSAYMVENSEGCLLFVYANE